MPRIIFLCKSENGEADFNSRGRIAEKNMIKKRLVGLLSHAKKYIEFQVFWQWLALIAQMTAVFSIAELLERVLYGLSDAAIMQRTVLVLLVCIAVRFVCERQAAAASYKASVDVKKILRQKIYDKMLRLGPAYREQVSTSEVMQVSTEGVEQLETYFGRYLPQLFYSLLAPVTLFVVLCRVSMKASVVLLICVPLIPLSIVAVQKIAKKLLNKYWSIYTGLGDSFLENLQGLTTLKIYLADDKKAVEMDEEAQTFRRITMKVLTMQLNSTSVMDIMHSCLRASGCWRSIRTERGRLDEWRDEERWSCGDFEEKCREDHAAADRFDQAVASYHAACDRAWNCRLSLCDLSDDPCGADDPARAF